jgi:hypothetical protein
MAKMRVDPGIFARINEINSGRLEKKRGNPGICSEKAKKQRKKQKYDKTNSSRSLISAAKVGAGDGGGCAGYRGFDGYIESEYG